MSDFEKNIKRNVDKALFEKIRDKQYGDGENTYTYTYGDVASWITWHRDDKGNFSDKVRVFKSTHFLYIEKRCLKGLLALRDGLKPPAFR